MLHLLYCMDSVFYLPLVLLSFDPFGAPPLELLFE